jgi:hypothetical protein
MQAEFTGISAGGLYHKKVAHQRDSKRKSKSIIEALDSRYFLASAPTLGTDPGHGQTRNDGVHDQIPSVQS